MRYEITSPDGKRFEVNAPDDASQDQVMAYAQQQWKVNGHKPVDPTEGMSGTDKFFAGVGKGMTDIGRGLGQRVGLVSEGDIAESRKRDEPLMNTGAGVAGNVTGNLAALVPAMFVPGANTVAGAAALGGATGFAQPTVEGESVLGNMAMGAALGGGSQYGIGKAAQFAMNRISALKDVAATQMAKNAVKDTAIREAGEAGYKTIPSVSGGSFTGRVLEGVTGKEKAAQLASVSNQPITDALARKALGVADDVPLNQETMRAVRSDAAKKGYDPIRQVPAIETDATFQQQISALTSRSDNAAKDFGAIVESDVKPFANELKKIQTFSGDTAVDASAIFREKASDAYGQGNKTLGKAYRGAAEAIEGQIERSLTAEGKDGAKALADFRAARTKMAQSFDFEKALREGQGVIDARVIGRLYAKSPDRLSGEVAQIGKAAAAMPEVMGVPKAGWSNPVTALDSGVGTLGSIIGGNPLPLAFPAARAAARYGLMSGPGQRAFTAPQYGPGAGQESGAMLLEALRARGMGATVPSIYTPQE